MKNIFTVILCLFIAFLFHTTAISKTYPSSPVVTCNTTDDTTNYYLELNGSIRQMQNVMASSGDNPWLDSAVVTVYLNDAVYSKSLTTKRGKCNFKLSLDRRYIVELSKPGFVSKRFEVNTKVPANKKDAFDFDFDMDIFKQVEGLNVSILDKPIALVIYSEPDNQFSYDKNYTNKINAQLKLLYRNYYILNKKQSLAKPASSKK